MKAEMDRVIDNVMEIERSLRVAVKIPHDEVDRIVVSRLIQIRNSECNRKEDTTYIDKTILWFLDEDEFQKYAIDKQEIEF